MPWVGRFWIGFVAALVVFVSATVSPDSASAQSQMTLSEIIASGSVDPNIKSNAWATTNQWLQHPGSAVSNGPGWASSKPSLTSRPQTLTAWARARTAVGGLSAGTWIPTIAVVTGGLTIGWEVGHASGASDWVRGKLLGWGVHYTAGTITGTNWSRQIRPGGTGWQPFDPNSLAGGAAYNAYRLTAAGTMPDSCPAFRHHFGVANTSYPCTATGDGQMQTALQTVGAATTVGAEEFTCVADGAGPNTCDGGGTVSYGEWWFFPPQHGSPLNTATITELAPYNSAVHLPFRTTAIASQPREGDFDYTTGEAGNAIDAIASDPELDLEIGRILLPGTGSSTDAVAVPLPQPYYYETALQYRSRLRSLGYLGRIEIRTHTAGEANALPEFGPKQMTTITVTPDLATPLVEFPYPLNDPWPDNPVDLPIPGRGSATRIDEMPEDVPTPEPEAPGSPENPNPGPVPPGDEPGPGEGHCDCSVVPLNLSPITTLDYGEVFPFGALVWAGDTLGDLTTTADAPVFTFDHFGEYGIESDYVVDFSLLDPYMVIIRTIISWAMWVGAIWWTAATMLGYRATGDPGEAIDEAWA